MNKYAWMFVAASRIPRKRTFLTVHANFGSRAKTARSGNYPSDILVKKSRARMKRQTRQHVMVGARLSGILNTSGRRCPLNIC